MRPEYLLTKKRNAQELTQREIQTFVDGAAHGTFSDDQLSAMLMAIAINGMNYQETAYLTMAMAQSGQMLDLSGIEGIKADKHSTGGVGDTTTLVLVPLVACCGIKVAKMSGRGLGHTGGTLDKLESIPGFQVELPNDRFIDVVNRVGCAVIGQSTSLAPADKKLYALRDVTATVDSIPLIASSILSKKIAAGCDVVVLDVKSGNGAMMQTLEGSIRLAQHMVQIGTHTGKKFSAVITDMNQPLGMYIGNALEVKEAIAVLRGEVHGPLLDVSLELGAHMLLNGGIVESKSEAIRLLKQKIISGEGLEKFAQMIEAQSGNPDVISDLSLLPSAPKRVLLRAKESGFVCQMDTQAIGNAARMMGAGRNHKEDQIDLSVGIVMHKRIGDRVQAGDILCEMHLSERSDQAQVQEMLASAICIGQEPTAPPKLIHAIVTESGIEFF